jgi:proteasome accessory factor A
MQELSQDQNRQWIVRLESGKTISAIDIQEAFLAAARAHYRGQDDETDWVLDQWEAVLRDLRGDYTTLVGRVDWASKLWLLETFREAEQTTWADPVLKSLDLESHGRRAGSTAHYGQGDYVGNGPSTTQHQSVWAG